MIAIFARGTLRMLLVAAAAMVAWPALAQTATPLVSVDWLRTHLGNPDVLVLDIRSAIDGGGGEAYGKGHIPGAVHSDYDKAGWRVTRNGVPYMLPTPVQIEKVVGELGIDEDTHVVVVPAGVSATDFGSAARVYWTLKVSGVSKVSILDGGYAAWVADQRSTIETGVNAPSPKIFTATFDRSLLAEASDVEKLQASGAALIDARPAAFFLGKIKAPDAKAYGHIPGAINLDSASFYDPSTNRLRPKEQLAVLAASVPVAGPVVSYCNTGHWAATDWFVLSELLGRRDVKLYYGSMVDWTSDARRPLVSARTKWDDVKKVLGLGS